MKAEIPRLTDIGMTHFSMLAQQAESFAENNPQDRGIWLMIAEALSARDLFRTGWLLACCGYSVIIPDESAERVKTKHTQCENALLMHRWITERRDFLMEELRG